MDSERRGFDDVSVETGEVHCAASDESDVFLMNGG